MSPVAPLKATEADYNRLFVLQGGRCAICQKRSPKRRFDRDHDHVTGRLRGLLCRRCNEGLGRFEWDVAVILRLIAYGQAIIEDRSTFTRIEDPT